MRNLTDKQKKFLTKVFELTDCTARGDAHKRVLFSTSLSGHSNRIDLVCRRILTAGFYDTKYEADMEKLNYIRDWYIRTHKKLTKV